MTHCQKYCRKRWLNAKHAALFLHLNKGPEKRHCASRLHSGHCCHGNTNVTSTENDVEAASERHFICGCYTGKCGSDNGVNFRQILKRECGGETERAPGRTHPPSPGRPSVTCAFSSLFLFRCGTLGLVKPSRWQKSHGTVPERCPFRISGSLSGHQDSRRGAASLKQPAASQSGKAATFHGKQSARTCWQDTKSMHMCFRNSAAISVLQAYRGLWL